MIYILLALAASDLVFKGWSIDTANEYLVQVVDNAIYFSGGDSTCIEVIELDQKIRSVDGNPDLPMVIVTFQSGNHLLVDLPRKILKPLSIAAAWSPDGAYALAATSVSFQVIPATHLWKCDLLEHCTGSVSIDGHPLGETVALKWLDAEQLLYRTGAGELTCFGIVNVSQSQNYFLGCFTLGEMPRPLFHPRPVTDDYFLQKFGDNDP